VVDFTLEEFQRNQSIRISRDIIGQSEEHEQKMQTNAQKSWENAHKQLVALLRFLDQDYDESCEKATRPLESFSDDDLAYLIHVRLRSLNSVVSNKGKPDETLKLKQDFAELGRKYADLEQRILILQDVNRKFQADNAALNAHLSALRQVQVEDIPTANPVNTAGKQESKMSTPKWIKTWQAVKVFEKTSTAILVMGDTGFALRPSIVKQMAKHLSLSETNKGLNEAINWLMKPDDNTCPMLVEELNGESEQGSSAGGKLPSVLHLSISGQTAYQILTGRTAKENQYDILIKDHSSPEHTILNIQVAEILKEEGYEIRGLAQKFQLSNGEVYIPDIVSVDPKTGEVIFIEVERDVHKDQMSRKQKWMKLLEASNGNLYVFCDNLNCQRAIQGEINLALNGLAYNSYLTNLHGVGTGKRSEKDGSIWLSQRQGKDSGERCAHRSSHIVPLES